MLSTLLRLCVYLLHILSAFLCENVKSNLKKTHDGLIFANIIPRCSTYRYSFSHVSPLILIRCIGSDRCCARDCVNASNHFHRRRTNCRFRKTTSYAILSLFFFLVSYGDARARVFFFGKSRSRLYYLATYVEKRDLIVRRQRADPSRSVLRQQASSVSRKLSRSRIQFAPFTESHR